MPRKLRKLHGTEYFDPARLPIAVIPFSDHPDYGLHAHDFTEILIILKGSGINIIDGVPFRIRAGDVYVIQGNHAHEFRNMQGVDVLMILFSPRHINIPEFATRQHPGFAALFLEVKRRGKKHPFSHAMTLQPSRLAKVEAICAQMTREIDLQGTGYELSCLALLFELLALLSRSYVSPLDIRSDEPIKIGRAIRLLEQNLVSSISSKEIAQQIGLSESHFYRMFKRVTGSSPSHYLRELRLRNSAKLLKSTDKSITQIAYDLGFMDSNYFTREFRKFFGIPPLKFRKAPLST